MICRLSYYVSPSLDPYMNLAAESWFMKNVGEDELVLYLWRNERTVVIGRNQNIWSEVNVKALDELGVHAARRLSGGGAVYHDAGNLNFTFISSSANSDIPRQTEVILSAIRKLGFDAEKNGRNDLCVEGRKFSGHSYHLDCGKVFHNGTILIDTDTAILSSVLTPSREKLQAKGVQSVKSRTINLSELSPSIGLAEVMEALKSAFEKEYGLIAATPAFPSVPLEMVEKFASPEWIFNTAANFEDHFTKRFDWGTAEVWLDVRKGVVRDCVVYTDSLDTTAADSYRKSLIGKPYST